MFSLSVLAIVAASITSQPASAGTVTSITTVYSTTYLPLEQCCAGTPIFAISTMHPKPSSPTSLSSTTKPKAPISQASDGQIQASVEPSQPTATGSPSATLSAPSDVCTAGPSTLGADCSATQHCCAPVSCDSTTLKCINPDGSFHTYFKHASRLITPMISNPNFFPFRYTTIHRTELSSNR